MADAQTNVFTEGGDFSVEDSFDHFRESFELARRDGDPIIRAILAGKEIVFNTDKIVAFAPVRPTVRVPEPDAFAERRAQPCICGHQRQVHREGGRCQYSPDIGAQCGCEGFEAQ